MSSHSPNRSEKIAAWLREAFSEDELSLLFADFPPETPLKDNLAPGSHAKRCAEAIGLLERHGALDGAFFDRLREERPRRVEEIDRLARLYPDGHGELEVALAGYRARLVDELCLVELPSLPEPDRVEQTAIELLELFVPQHVNPDAPRHDHASRRLDDERRAAPSESQALDEILVSAESPWLLLLGPQGVGKSMATQWLVLKLCVEGHYPAALPPGLVPVRIELRRFTRMRRKAGEDGYDFFDYLAAQAREARHSLHRADFQRLAGAGRLVWLFDGLDEVVDVAERGAILDQILALRAGGRGVLTCRLVGSEPIRDRIARHGVQCVTLHEFDDEQVDRFLARWHALAFPSGRGATRRERLAAAIRTNVTLRDLSHNPFLLSLVVVHMDVPPRGRRELLERATEQLLDAWDANRGITGPPRFSHAIKRRYLETLAWHMMASADGTGNVIGEAQLLAFTRDFCEQQFPKEQNIADSTARALLDHLRGRACIFGYSGDGAYGFLHRSFLGFLGASEIYNRFRVDGRIEPIEVLFATHWHEWQWRQTLALTCAFLRDRPELVVRLIQAAVGAAGPRFPFTALDMLAELCILGLAEAGVGAGEPSVARECAAAVNDWLYHSPEWHGIEGTLTQLFGSVAGQWPGLRELIARPLPEGRDGSVVLPFVAGLPDEKFLPAVLDLLEARVVQPFIVHRLQELNRWRDAFTSELQRLAVAAADSATALTLALTMAHEAFLPWPRELRERVLAAASEELRAGVQGCFAAADEHPREGAAVARALRLQLALACSDTWPELVFSHAFTRDLFGRNLAPAGLAIVRRAFDAVSATPLGRAGLFHEIVASKDLSFLAALLNYCEARPVVLRGLHNAFVHHPWAEGLTRAIAWARARPALQSFARDAAALHALQFPEDEAWPSRLERSLRVYADGAPPIMPEGVWFTTVHMLSFQLDDQTRQDIASALVQIGQSCYPDDELEFALAVAAFVDPGNDGALLPLIEEATSRRPLLAAYYRRSLTSEDRFPSPPDVDALLADIRSEADERRLLEYAGLARWVAFWERRALPWQAIYRHLLAHGSSAAISIEAAVELADREPLERLQQSSPDSQELIDALAFLDARDRLLRVGRPP